MSQFGLKVCLSANLDCVETSVYLFFAGSTNTFSFSTNSVSSKKPQEKESFILLAASLIVPSRFLTSLFCYVLYLLYKA